MQGPSGFDTKGLFAAIRSSAAEFDVVGCLLLPHPRVSRFPSLGVSGSPLTPQTVMGFPAAPQ